MVTPASVRHAMAVLYLIMFHIAQSRVPLFTEAPMGGIIATLMVIGILSDSLFCAWCQWKRIVVGLREGSRRTADGS
jgi:hypothetical protein